LGQRLLLLENALKLNFEALYLTENLNPLQGTTHNLTLSSINTQNRSKTMYGFIMICTDFSAAVQKSQHTEKQGFCSWLSRKIPDTPTQTS